MSKRRRTEGPATGVLSARQAATRARVEGELANAAPDMPQLAEMLQLSKALGQQGAAAGEARCRSPCWSWC